MNQNIFITKEGVVLLLSSYSSYFGTRGYCLFCGDIRKYRTGANSKGQRIILEKDYKLHDSYFGDVFLTPL
jgi:hypothetical protein